MSTLNEISQMVVTGQIRTIKAKVQQALDEGIGAQEILDGGLLPGINEIGEKFARNEVFVPNVLLAAKVMNMGVEVIQPLLAAGESTKVGTAKGDLHDIGKNLVALMMRSANLEVIDLGSNVDGAKFIDAINKYNPDVIGLSALLTTTMNEQGHIIQQLTDAGVRDKVKVMVGGAPVTQMWADKIGADAFTADAAEAAQWAKTYAASKGA